jgi:uncharacterized protein (DUF4415 family)
MSRHLPSLKPREIPVPIGDESSNDEARWITLGMTAAGDLLVVVWTWRAEVMRLISARPASPRECRQYEEQKMKSEYDFSKPKRGPVFPAEPGKTRITIRLDNAVLDWFRGKAHEAGGASYQSLINEALRGHMPQPRNRWTIHCGA